MYIFLKNILESKNYFFTDYTNSKFADVLQEATLKIHDTEYCRNRLKKKLLNPETGICAGDGNGVDTCNGDSGGPLVLTDTKGIQSFVVGITSFGPEVCGVKGTQGLYTNVNHYVPWILQNLKP